MKYRALKRIALKLFIFCIAFSFYFVSRPINADVQQSQIVTDLFSNCHSIGSGLCNCAVYAPGSAGAKRMPPSFFNCNAMFMCWCETFQMVSDPYGNCYFPGQDPETPVPDPDPDPEIYFCIDEDTGIVYECKNLPPSDPGNRTLINCNNCKPPTPLPPQQTISQQTAIAEETLVPLPTFGPTPTVAATMTPSPSGTCGPLNTLCGGTTGVDCVTCTRTSPPAVCVAGIDYYQPNGGCPCYRCAAVT